MEKLQAELGSLRARAETLNSRRAATDTAVSDVKLKLQRYNLEADLDADDKVRAKLEPAVAASVLTRDDYADTLARCRPNNIAAPGDRIPAAVAEMIARAMPQPRNSAIAAIRARMLLRQKKVFGDV